MLRIKLDQILIRLTPYTLYTLMCVWCDGVLFEQINIYNSTVVCACERAFERMDDWTSFGSNLKKKLFILLLIKYSTLYYRDWDDFWNYDYRLGILLSVQLIIERREGNKEIEYASNQMANIDFSSYRLSETK